MNGALTERRVLGGDPLQLFEDAHRRVPAGAPWQQDRFDGGRLTLERRLESVWEDLDAAGAAKCPLCRGRMTRPADAVADPARCDDCGSTLV